MSRSWVAIQRNPRSGSGRRKVLLLELVAALKRAGLRPRVFSRREKLTDRLNDSEARGSLQCIVAAGGDGTAGDIANRFPDLPVFPFPLGTENLLCKYLGIRPDGQEAAATIAAGKRRQLDVGLASDRRFLLIGSAGFDADVIRRLHESRRGNISHLSYLKPIVGATFGFSYPNLRVFADDNSEPVQGSMAVVSNIPAYALGLPITHDAQPDDGVFDVCVLHKPGTLRLLNYFSSVVRNRHTTRSDITTIRAQRLRIESDVPCSLQLDGDPAGMTPSEFSMLPAALDVITP